MNKCTDKEWKYCQEEKMGCSGCAYNNKIEQANKILEELCKASSEELLSDEARVMFNTIMFLAENEKQERVNLHIMEHVIIDLLNNISTDKIKNEIKQLKDMKVEGEVFTTAVNFAIKELESLL